MTGDGEIGGRRGEGEERGPGGGGGRGAWAGSGRRSIEEAGGRLEVGRRGHLERPWVALDDEHRFAEQLDEAGVVRRRARRRRAPARAPRAGTPAGSALRAARPLRGRDHGPSSSTCLMVSTTAVPGTTALLRRHRGDDPLEDRAGVRQRAASCTSTISPRRERGQPGGHGATALGAARTTGDVEPAHGIRRVEHLGRRALGGRRRRPPRDPRRRQHPPQGVPENGHAREGHERLGHGVPKT